MPETQATRTLPGVLATIVASKKREVEELRPRAGIVEAGLATAPAPRDFAGALRAPGVVSLIAECKRRSPGAGDIRPGLDPVALTVGYQGSGARALSVLTDGPFFGGSLADLTAVRAAVTIPVLRKDFTIDRLQIREARAAGADAILLIVRILTDAELRSLMAEAEALGMTALVETHDASELERSLDAGAKVVGINNRDLSNFTTSLGTTMRLLDSVPPDVVVVSESGIRSAEDVRTLGEAGVDAVLVGETLLKAESPSAMAAALATLPKHARGGGHG